MQTVVVSKRDNHFNDDGCAVSGFELCVFIIDKTKPSHHTALIIFICLTLYAIHGSDPILPYLARVCGRRKQNDPLF